MVSFSRSAPPIAARLVARADLESELIPGPAVIESYDTTIVVPPRCTARAAGAGCIAIEMEDSDG
jgi:N-methylhydantoinase A